jgi:2,4-dienoyl-CoA reductase-like NADH-dependent reductase (Old Yellow Enzyme family)
MSALFSPLQLREVTIPNRIVVSPMCQYVAVDGEANSWHSVHMTNMAISGAGMLIIEATAVEPAGRITPGDLGLWDDRTEQALKTAVDTVREHSTIPIVLQLGHAGRKASSAVPWKGGQLLSAEQGGWPTFAPSPIPQKEGEVKPIELDADGLERLRKAFADATRRAVRLGVDGIELHGAHGYLLHEFLSPISNHRTDAYGGSLENRMRFPLEIFDIVRAELPEWKPLGVKVSATDWVEDGWDLLQTIAFSRELKARGVDWVDASSGGISPKQKIVTSPGYQVPFADAIKFSTGAKTMSVGLITGAEQAEGIVSSGAADMVAIARGMLYNPRWGWHAAAELGASVEAPPQYWRAPPQEHAAIFGDIQHGAR